MESLDQGDGDRRRFYVALKRTSVVWSRLQTSPTEALLFRHYQVSTASTPTSTIAINHLELGTQSGQKLMRNDEDENVCILRRFQQIRDGDDILRKLITCRAEEACRNELTMGRLQKFFSKRSDAKIPRPGRYLTFSWSVLMISVSFRPSTSSSKTHIRTSSANSSRSLALAPTIRQMAEPQLPAIFTRMMPELIRISRYRVRKAFRGCIFQYRYFVLSIKNRLLSNKSVYRCDNHG